MKVYAWDAVHPESAHPFGCVWMFVAARSQVEAAKLAGYSCSADMENLFVSVNTNNNKVALMWPGTVYWRERDRPCDVELYYDAMEWLKFRKAKPKDAFTKFKLPRCIKQKYEKESHNVELQSLLGDKTKKKG